MKDVLSRSFLKDLGFDINKLQQQVTTLLGTTAEAIRETLAGHGITDGEGLREKGPRWFQKTFGVQELGVFLGRKVGNITQREVQELEGKLGWRVESKEG